MKKRVIILLLFLPAVFAQNYYADVTISVDSEGIVSINGLTNHPTLYSNNYSDFISKKQDYFLLNVSLNDEFTQYVYTISLPPGAVINYLNTPKVMSITNKQDNIIITAVGSDESFKAAVQYSLNDSFSKSYMILIYLTPFIILYFLIFRNKNKNKNFVDYSLLTDRQESIMRIIEKKKRVTQKRLEKDLDIPKSSLSRNINSLINKGLIEKRKKGMTNILILKK